MPPDVRTVAARFVGAGYSVFPLRLDGSKKVQEGFPTWKPWQSQIAKEADLDSWYGAGRAAGIAIVHGAISGNSEILDFDVTTAFGEFYRLCEDHGLSALVDRCVRVQTPTGGTHLYYRCAEAVEGNKKLAQIGVPIEVPGDIPDDVPIDVAMKKAGYRPSATSPTGWVKIETKIETRGEGGYTVAPGSPKEVHELHVLYSRTSGSFAGVPVFTVDERKALLDMARACNEYAEKEHRQAAAQPSGKPARPANDSAVHARPGDDYNERVTTDEVLSTLLQNGWTVTGHRGDTVDLARPGKSKGISATLNQIAPGVFYCFTSSVSPFEPSTSYTPFQVYGLLVHNGDFAAAARQLGADGYGDQAVRPRREDRLPSPGDDDAPPAGTSDRKPKPKPSVVESAPPEFDRPPTSLTTELLVVPAMTPEYIPAPLRDWVRDIAERGSFPIEYVAAAAIVALAATTGRRVAIRPKQHDEWTVVPNLWGAVVGPPGLQKTPAVTEALRPLHRLEKIAQKMFEKQQEAHKIADAVGKAKADGARDKLKTAAKKNAPEHELTDLARAAMSLEDVKEPVWKRYIINDATVEKLGKLLEENPNGLLVFRDELTGFFRSMDRMGHEQDRGFYLEAWNGNGTYAYDRIARGTVIIENTCVSLFGTIQPGPLARYLQKATSGDDADGFAPRLQILVFPNPPRTFKNVDRWPDTAAKNHAFDVFQAIDRINPFLVGAVIDEGEDLPYLRFTSAAQAIFDAWRTDLEVRLRTGTETPLMETHLAKYRSLIPSLALLFHLVNLTTTPDEDVPAGVTAAALDLAICWGEFLESHARRIYQSTMDGDPEAAQRLAERIKQTLPNPFTYRDIARKQWAGLTEPDEVERAIGLLEDRRWVKVVERAPKPGSAGGRPTFDIYVNPVFRTEGTDKTDKTPGEVGFVSFVSGSDHTYADISEGVNSVVEDITTSSISSSSDDVGVSEDSVYVPEGTDKTDKTPGEVSIPEDGWDDMEDPFGDEVDETGGGE